MNAVFSRLKGESLVRGQGSVSSSDQADGVWTVVTRKKKQKPAWVSKLDGGRVGGPPTPDQEILFRPRQKLLAEPLQLNILPVKCVFRRGMGISSRCLGQEGTISWPPPKRICPLKQVLSAGAHLPGFLSLAFFVRGTIIKSALRTRPQISSSFCISASLIRIFIHRVCLDQVHLINRCLVAETSRAIKIIGTCNPLDAVPAAAASHDDPIEADILDRRRVGRPNLCIAHPSSGVGLPALSAGPARCCASQTLFYTLYPPSSTHSLPPSHYHHEPPRPSPSPSWLYPSCPLSWTHHHLL